MMLSQISMGWQQQQPQTTHFVPLCSKSHAQAVKLSLCQDDNHTILSLHGLYQWPQDRISCHSCMGQQKPIAQGHPHQITLRLSRSTSRLMLSRGTLALRSYPKLLGNLTRTLAGSLSVPALTMSLFLLSLAAASCLPRWVKSSTGPDTAKGIPNTFLHTRLQEGSCCCRPNCRRVLAVAA